MNLEMQAICPECAREQNVRFDMQTFLLVRLKKERPRLLYEIHRIASSYHWSQQEILQLPRTLRKQYVELIEGR
jgi:Cft2 family RNA processing exonuclease